MPDRRWAEASEAQRDNSKNRNHKINMKWTKDILFSVHFASILWFSIFRAPMPALPALRSGKADLLSC
jgi:hypothetical protein